MMRIEAFGRRTFRPHPEEGAYARLPRYGPRLAGWQPTRCTPPISGLRARPVEYSRLFAAGEATAAEREEARFTAQVIRLRRLPENHRKSDAEIAKLAMAEQAVRAA